MAGDLSPSNWELTTASCHHLDFHAQSQHVNQFISSSWVPIFCVFFTEIFPSLYMSWCFHFTSSFMMSGHKNVPAPTAALSEKLEYLQWLTRLKDIQFESELVLIVSFPLCLSENTCSNPTPLSFKYQIEFTSFFLS